MSAVNAVDENEGEVASNDGTARSSSLLIPRNSPSAVIPAPAASPAASLAASYSTLKKAILNDAASGSWPPSFTPLPAASEVCQLYNLLSLIAQYLLQISFHDAF